MALERSPRYATTIRVFRWSGDNTHTARVDAGRALAATIKADIEGGAGTLHHLVGHSHGGNVIAYAMRDVEPGRVGRVVTIGTPFVSCAARRLTADAAPLAPMLLFSVIIITVFGSLLLLQGAKGHVEFGAWARLLGAFALTICMLVAVPALLFWGERIWKWLLSKADVNERRIVAELALPPIGAPLLCIKTAHDEAGDGLGAVTLLGDLLFMFVAVLRRALVWAPIGFLAAAAFTNSVQLFHLTPSAWARVTMAWVARVASGVIAGWAPYVLLAAAVTYALRHIVYGGESFVGALLVRVTPSVVPDSAAILQMRTVEFSEVEDARQVARKARRVGWTRHSAICDLESTRAAIATWLS